MSPPAHGCERQELHRLVDAVGSRPGSADRFTQSLPARTIAELPVGLLDRRRRPPHRAGTPCLRRSSADPALEETLLHLELGDAVTQEPTGAIGAPNTTTRCPPKGAAAGGGQAPIRRSDALPVRNAGGCARPSLLPGAVDDPTRPACGHRIAVDAEHARGSSQACTSDP